jgi:hypothetical protein
MPAGKINDLFVGVRYHKGFLSSRYPDVERGCRLNLLLRLGSGQGLQEMQALSSLTRQLFEDPRFVVNRVPFGRIDRVLLPADPDMAATALEGKDGDETFLTRYYALGTTVNHSACRWILPSRMMKAAVPRGKVATSDSPDHCSRKMSSSTAVFSNEILRLG